MGEREMTTGEAEAWLLGWRAAQEAAARVAEGDKYARTPRQIAVAIRAMEPPR